ncbi:hypothetical protein MRX96_034686 [Rhipicephalus microplus]
MDLDISRESAREKVAEAHHRLAFNYFVLAGVVKAEMVCHRIMKGKKRKTTLDMIGRDMHVCICSYLSLTDVVDFQRSTVFFFFVFRAAVLRALKTAAFHMCLRALQMLVKNTQSNCHIRNGSIL